MKKEYDEKLEGEARKQRMDALEARIGMTDSGIRFVDRVRNIGLAKPLRSEPEQESEPHE